MSPRVTLTYCALLHIVVWFWSAGTGFVLLSIPFSSLQVLHPIDFLHAKAIPSCTTLS